MKSPCRIRGGAGLVAVEAADDGVVAYDHV